jgi:hypothetical protein
MAVFVAGIVLLLKIWSERRSGTQVDATKDMEDVHKCMHVLQSMEDRSVWIYHVFLSILTARIDGMLRVVFGKSTRFFSCVMNGLLSIFFTGTSFTYCPPPASSRCRTRNFTSGPSEGETTIVRLLQAPAHLNLQPSQALSKTRSPRLTSKCH